MMPRKTCPTVAPATIGATALISLCLVGGEAIHASDLRVPPGTQVAAAAIDGDLARVSRPRMPGEEPSELELQLAQSTSPKTGIEILAGFPRSAPESLEEEVATAHNLEIVRRFLMEFLDRRVVVFRFKDSRAPTEVVAALKVDARVASAQVNERYALPQQPPEPDSDSDVQPTPGGPARQAKKRAALPDGKSRMREAPAKLGARTAAGEAAMAAKPAAPPRSEQGSLVASKQAALRFPTADEPFVNVVGARK